MPCSCRRWHGGAAEAGAANAGLRSELQAARSTSVLICRRRATDPRTGCGSCLEGEGAVARGGTHPARSLTLVDDVQPDTSLFLDLRLPDGQTDASLRP